MCTVKAEGSLPSTTYVHTGEHLGQAVSIVSGNVLFFITRVRKAYIQWHIGC